MQQRPIAPGDFYEPDPFARTSKAGPPAPPSTASWFDEIGASFRSAATTDEAPVRMRAALDTALAGVVSDLKQQGVDTRRLQRRDPRAGFALVYDEDAIWEAAQTEKRRDPRMFKALPNTLDEFRQKATAPLRASIGEDAEVASQSGWSSWLLGTLGYGVTDPINTATLPLGIGATRSIGQAILKGAQLNIGIEALALPSRAVERAAQGRELSTSEGVASIALAGLAGGGLGGAGKVIERGFAPRSPIATEVRETIGVDRMTDAERGAADALDRDAEIDATNPFGRGAGSVAHTARLDAEISAILDRVAARDAPAPVATPPAARRSMSNVGGDARATFKRATATRESGGNQFARNPNSTATGLYQFTRGTWLNYHKRVVGGQMSDEARWAQATDVSLQERLMDAYIDDSLKALAKIGARETPGNLYLMHFAGQGGAGKILKAAPDTPIEQLLTAEAIRANGFLRGKTAGDVIEWAHATHGGDPDVPVLPRDRYSSDEQWAAAQREVDAAEAQLRAADAELARAATDDGPDVVPPLERYTAIDRSAEPVGMNWEPIRVETPSFERVVNPYVPPKAMPRRTRPSDVIEVLSDHGGLRDDLGHDLRGQGWAKLTVPPLVRKNGMDLDFAGELLWERGYFVTRPTEAEVLDLIDSAARGRTVGRRVYSLADQEPMDARADLLAQNDRAPYDVRQALADHEDVYDFDGADVDIFDEVLDRALRGIEPGQALSDIAHARQADALVRIKLEAEQGGIDDVFPDGWIPGFDDRPGGWASFADDSAGYGNPAAGIDGRTVLAGDARGGGADRAADGSSGRDPPEAIAARVAPFDDPFGAGATRQTDSLEHDLIMEIDPAIAARRRREADLRAASPMRATADQDSEIGMPLFDAADQGSFRLGEDGEAVGLAQLLDDLNGDEAAIGAARNCMVV